MSKLEDSVNEILGIEKKSTDVAVKDFEQAVHQYLEKLMKQNQMLIMIMNIVEITIIILLTKVIKQLKAY